MQGRNFQHALIFFRIDSANDAILYTASSDGTISSTDLDTGIGSPLLNLNPNGWNVSFHLLHRVKLVFITVFQISYTITFQSTVVGQSLVNIDLN